MKRVGGTATRVDSRSAELLTLFGQAVAHHGSGRLGEARVVYERLLRQLPNHPELLDRYGVLRHQLGDHEIALGFVDRAIARRPAAAATWNHLGSILRALGRQANAAAAFRRAALIEPAVPEPWINLGIVADERGDHDATLDAGRRALSIQPRLVDVQVRNAASLLRVGRPEDALDLLHAARRSAPLRADLALHLPSALMAVGRGDEALRAARTGIVASPATYELYPGLLACRDTGVVAGEVVEWAKRATRIRPAQATLRANYAAELYREGRFEDALREARWAYILDPRHQAALQNLMTLTCLERRYGQARRFAHWGSIVYSEASFVRFALAEIEMATGDLARAWDLYEARIERPDHLPKLGLPPRWPGPGSTLGRLLVVTEQGIGDELLYLSCLPDLLTDVPDPVVELDPRFLPLYRRSFPGVDFIPRQLVQDAAGRTTYDYDRVNRDYGTTHHIYNGSLAGIYRSDRSRPATRAGYLVPDASAVQEWRQKLASLGPEPKVGICWRSMLRTPARSVSYAPLELWDALLCLPGIRFVSLQYDDCRAEIEAARNRIGSGPWVPDGLDQKNNLDETAGLIAALDAVVSTGTSVCMLAAALGATTYRIGPSTHLIGNAHDHFFPNMVPLVPWSIDRRPDIVSALQRAAEILPEALTTEASKRGGLP